MNNLGFQEMMVIAIIALLVVGPDRLPELARKAGLLVARFKAETAKSVAELKAAADLGDLDKELRAISREVKDVGRSLAKTVTDPMSGLTVRADDAPPPMDPEAT